MKKVSLSTKIVGLVVTADFTVGACLFASTYYFVDKGFQDQTQQEIGGRPTPCSSTSTA